MRIYIYIFILKLNADETRLETLNNDQYCFC